MIKLRITETCSVTERWDGKGCMVLVGKDPWGHGGATENSSSGAQPGEMGALVA